MRIHRFAVVVPRVDLFATIQVNLKIGFSMSMTVRWKLVSDSILIQCIELIRQEGCYTCWSVYTLYIICSGLITLRNSLDAGPPTL